MVSQVGAHQVDVHVDGTRADQWDHHGPGFWEEISVASSAVYDMGDFDTGKARCREVCV